VRQREKKSFSFSMKKTGAILAQIGRTKKHHEVERTRPGFKKTKLKGVLKEKGHFHTDICLSRAGGNRKRANTL